MSRWASRLTELNVVAIEVKDLGAAEDGVILKLGLPDGWAVVADDDELGLAVSQALHGSLVAYRFKNERVRPVIRRRI